MNRPFAALAAIASFGVFAGCSSGTPITSGPPRTRLVFASDRTGVFEIYLLVLETGEVTQITSSDEAKRDPYISDSDVRITFAADSEPDVPENWDIYTMLRDGTNVVRVTTNPAEDRRPSYNPAANQIIYMTNRNGNWDIYLTNLVGATHTALTTDAADDRDPIYSPDGMKIYFSSNRNGKPEIWRMDPNGANQELVVDGPGELTSPMIGPDGMLYASSLQFGRNQIYRFDLTNGAVIAMTNTGNNFDPQPLDDEYLRFTSDRTSNLEVFTMKYSNGLQERVVANPFADVVR